MVALGDRSVVMPSVVYAREDGALMTGDSAARRLVSHPDQVASEVKRRLGDPTPVIFGGSAHSVTELLGALLRDVLDRVTAERGWPAGALDAHPPGELGAAPAGAVRGGGPRRRSGELADRDRAGGRRSPLRGDPSHGGGRGHRRLRPRWRDLRRDRARPHGERHRGSGQPTRHRASRRGGPGRRHPVLRQPRGRRCAGGAGPGRSQHCCRARPAAPGLRGGQGGAVPGHRGDDPGVPARPAPRGLTQPDAVREPDPRAGGVHDRGPEPGTAVGVDHPRPVVGGAAGRWFVPDPAGCPDDRGAARLPNRRRRTPQARGRPGRRSPRRVGA